MLRIRGCARCRLAGGCLPNHPPQNLTVATTGASGSVFLRQLLLAVERDARVRHVNFIASDSGLRVLAEELGIQGRSNLVGQILAGEKMKPSTRAPARISARTTVRTTAHSRSKIQEQSNADIGANVASGSYPADAGATIFPLIPAFYYRPARLDDMAREFAYRVLAHLGMAQPDAFQWKG